MMKKILTLAVLVAAFSVGVASADAFIPKNTTLQFVRFSSAGDNMLGSIPYTTTLANGRHNSTSASLPGSVLYDTSAAILVNDHMLNAIPLARTTAVSTADSTAIFGTLNITTTGSSIDTIYFYRDVSTDGKVWVVCDSLQCRTQQSNSTKIADVASNDYASFIGTTVTDASGGTTSALSIPFNVIPGMTTKGITAYATFGVNYVRFRIGMTTGDYYNAGANGGFTATFNYPAMDVNFNR